MRTGNWQVPKFSVLMAVVFPLVISLATDARGQKWDDPVNRATIENEALEASLQSGILVRLKDLARNKTLVNIDVTAIPDKLAIFGPSTIDLASCTVKQTATETSVKATFSAAGGTEWTLHWSFDASGDLVLRSSARTPLPVEEFRILLPGCSIEEHAMVWVDAYGVGHTANAPWEGTFLGDPVRDGSPQAFPHPLVALFQGHNSGWFIEARDERIGPACVMAKGSGAWVMLGIDRRFPIPTTAPVMPEIRFRTYKDHWEDAVDPYVKWLEEGAGLVPFEKLPAQQAWIGKLKTQAYPGMGDYAALEALAKRVNPAETFIGRQGEMRKYAFDVGYPDYRLTDVAKSWTKRARELGFHVGMHFNASGVSAMFPELVERFRPGFQIVGKDEKGNEVYHSIYQGQNRLYAVSAALQPWRDYLIDQMKDAVDAGVDVIYLDGSMSPVGKFMVDGVDAYQGMFLLMKGIQERYPHVGVETEQFNTMAGKYGKLALSQMPLGHPLSGYIFQRFIKVVPEGYMYSPIEGTLMDAFDVWGFMMPGADTMREESWMQIAGAFHKYQLVPDSRLPRTQVTRFVDHPTHGAVPELPNTIPESGEKLFGFRGINGVTAYLERYPTKRGLVVYEIGKSQQWIGTRHRGITTYAGSGVPAYFGYREYLKDWLIYDDQKILGLDSQQTYWFDTTVARSPTRFHLFKVPEDFAGVSCMERRTAPQEVGKDEAYFILRMAGRGEIGVYVPEDYDAYLNGVKLKVDHMTKQALATIDASKTGTPGLGYHIELNPDEVKAKPTAQAGPAVLLAVRKIGTDLVGNWRSLPLYRSVDSAKWIDANSSNGFYMNVGTVGRLVGLIPKSKSVRIQGAYQIREQTDGQPGDGVICINGVEVLRVPCGKAPFKQTPFDVDISSYAGQHVLLEFASDADVRGATADWLAPRFVIER